MAELVQTAANVAPVTVGGIAPTPSHGISGGTITAGMPIYVDDADDNKIKAARANAVLTAKCNGIAANNASAGQPVSYYGDGSTINVGATTVLGETYCVSDLTAGKIVPIGDYGSGDYPVILGGAITTTGHIQLKINAYGVAKP